MGNAAGFDIHAHFYPQAYLDLIAKDGARFEARYDLAEGDRPIIKVGALRAGPLAPEFTELEPRLAEMDRQGVQMQALSLTQPMVYWADGKFGLELAQTFNDALAEAHQSHPDRFLGLATLPMQDPALATAEVERVANLPGIKGFYLATHILDRALSDDSFFEVYERIESLGLPLFLHPLEVIGADRLKPYFLTNLLGNPFDTAVAAAQLIFGGVLDRFPRLEVCLPHAGGAFPFLVGRLNHGWKMRPECRHLEQGPETYLKRFHYDTISHSAEALSYLIGRVGADRVLLGSDYCFDMGYDRPVEIVTQHPDLNDAERALILGGNARRLLGV